MSISVKRFLLNFVIFNFFCILLLSLTAKSVAPEDLKIIKRSEDKVLVKPIIEWAKKNKEMLWEKYYLEADSLGDLQYYVVDANNDGIDEFVFLKYKGMYGYTYFEPYIFTKNKEVIQVIDSPQWQDFSAVEEFINPLTKESELFVKAQNKIYICLSDSDKIERRVYLWEKDKFSLVCDKFWINQQRDLFNKLYQKKLYNDAYLFLCGFENTYKNYLEPELDLWIKNDIALAAFHDGYPQVGLKFINSIKGDTFFTKASSKLKKAVENNENLCSKSTENEYINGSKGKFDYSWLLNYKDKSLDDPRLESLYSALIPDIQNPTNTNWGRFSNSSGRWKDEVKRHLGIYYPQVKISDNRYVTFEGYLAHLATQRGFVWCDIKDQVSVAAIGGNNCEEDMLYLTSRTLKAKELPIEFYNAMNLWLQENEITFSGIIFYDYTGKPASINFVIKSQNNTQNQ